MKFSNKVLLFLVFLVMIPIGVQLSKLLPADKIEGIIGTDDRVEVESFDWPWQAIGKVYRENNRGYCTGLIISPNHILTVAHCLYDEDRRTWLKPNELSFIAGEKHQQFVGEYRIAQIHLAPHYSPDKTGTVEGFVDDWAILTLHEPTEIKPLAFTKMNAQELIKHKNLISIVRAGYSQDHAEVLMADYGCQLYGQLMDGKIMLHDCDSTEGDSGSPFLLIKGDGSVELLAMHLAISENPKYEHGLALPISAIQDEIHKYLSLSQ